jgi:hypothetical protein
MFKPVEPEEQKKSSLPPIGGLPPIAIAQIKNANEPRVDFFGFNTQMTGRSEVLGAESMNSSNAFEIIEPKKAESEKQAHPGDKSEVSQLASKIGETLEIWKNNKGDIDENHFVKKDVSLLDDIDKSLSMWDVIKNGNEGSKGDPGSQKDGESDLIDPFENISD